MRRSLAALAVALPLLAGAVPAQAAEAPPPGVMALQLPNFDALLPSGAPVVLRDAPRALDVRYTLDGRTRNLDEFLARTATQGFVALDGDQVVAERYAAADRTTLFQSWSMGKSFTSAVIGIAVGEGKIRSIDDPVRAYVPELAATTYADVTVRNLLGMSSGHTWNDQVDNIPLHVLASLGVPTTSLASQLKRGWEPGSRFNYNSVDTAVLALVLARATGTPYHRYVQEKLWRPAGMESTAYVGNDSRGNALGYCCFYATARDFARFGLLYLNGGRAGGRQVVPRAWVDASVSPSTSPRYGFQWWIDGDDGFFANGLGGQRIYVSRKHRAVVVKNTLYSLNEADSLPALRAIAAEIARTRAGALTPG
ncbi:serine hydrolase domain-containing protein [Actinomadura flavalba]|uniref:serine hydrolase domain-containing protein n=1 Tax=Actinomadura flavalba TaxID=1120938 RepID=UPI00036885BE|nr:serine hydrolase [Actinomadura flavalba]